MNCIFCHKSSLNSISVEHIIPESLGNKEFVLDKGYVCDKCNNYFAIKIEQPMLQMPFFIQHRHDLDIENKKGKIPAKDGFLLDAETSKVTFRKTKNKEEIIETDEYAINKLIRRKVKKIPAIIIEYGAPMNNVFISKFIGKAGIELLTYEAVQNGFDESYYNQESLNNIKRYIRSGEKNEIWPYFTRQLYNSQAGFKDKTGYLKVICTWQFILTPDQQLLFQFFYMGTEFTIDLLNPDTQSMEQWLQSNNNKSIILEKLIKQYSVDS